MLIVKQKFLYSRKDSVIDWVFSAKTKKITFQSTKVRHL
nr:MAG TPA: hypothetical protein [Caudoviricetes sp.]